MASVTYSLMYLKALSTWSGVCKLTGSAFLTGQTDRLEVLLEQVEDASGFLSRNGMLEDGAAALPAGWGLLFCVFTSADILDRTSVFFILLWLFGYIHLLLTQRGKCYNTSPWKPLCCGTWWCCYCSCFCRETKACPGVQLPMTGLDTQNYLPIIFNFTTRIPSNIWSCLRSLVRQKEFFFMMLLFDCYIIFKY